MIHRCRECNTILVVGKNVTQYRIDTSQRICKECKKEYQRDWKRDWCHRTGRQQPMDKNRECTSFLGVHVAERVLSHVFKNVQRMPNNNRGYDFICGGGYMVDVKSSCRRRHTRQADTWKFNIKKNQIAQYFLCLAFDNRADLTPEHIWLIPAGNISDKTGVSISESRLYKWSKYEMSIDQVTSCCNTIKEMKT